MSGNVVETLIGAVVLAVAGLFLFFAYSTADVGDVTNGYKLVAKFDRVDGLAPGSDVRIGGIKVGSIGQLNLEPDSYLAVVTMNIDSNIQLPEDSSAKISSDGLLGSNYLSLEPGGAIDMLADGGEIPYTQGAVDIVNLIGQAIFSATDSGKKNEAQQ
jgi:phospholipid/cholesterol/gamma-HCH transport system substrate-binding protein